MIKVKKYISIYSHFCNFLITTVVSQEQREGDAKSLATGKW
jgi:hypothetical protein